MDGLTKKNKKKNKHILLKKTFNTQILTSLENFWRTFVHKSNQAVYT